VARTHKRKIKFAKEQLKEVRIFLEEDLHNSTLQGEVAKL
jgi:hypothetical protein